MKTFAAFVVIGGITWWGLWFTPDQQGQLLEQRGQYEAAAQSYRDPMRQGIAWFRAGEFEKAEQSFARVPTPEAEFNRGNCLVMRGKYEDAIERFNRSLELRPGWEDAEINRSVAVARAKLTERKGEGLNRSMRNLVTGSRRHAFRGPVSPKPGVASRRVGTLGCFLFLLPFSSSESLAVETVRATIKKETVWTGEPVPLVITLYSPGPFSGTASFELPELPGTVFVNAGNPVVGSEEIDDDSYFTQRHEFSVYAQRSGEIIIPPFQVRFAGKKTFTSEPEPMEGSTPELRFQSKRPPGTDSKDVVVCATDLQVRQTWTPEPTREFESGDVVQRTIVRNAQGTTAMMLPPVSVDAPEGVRVHTEPADVQDSVNRGESGAGRTDVIKYQFQRAGSFALPDLTFVWWDPAREELRNENLPGLAIRVNEAIDTAPPPDTIPRASSVIWKRVAIGLFVFGLLLWLLRTSAARLITIWQTHHDRPEARAVRKLRAACASNNASDAYAALLAWRSTKQGTGVWDPAESLPDGEQNRELREHWQSLSRQLFASGDEATSWNGSPLWSAFCATRRRSGHRSRRGSPAALPSLNPTTAEASDR